jgi:hypothetical protein
VGVFDTPDRIRLPRWARRWLPGKVATLGFADDHLPECVQHGFQALALNRTRSDPQPMLWTQSDTARGLGQTIKQVWFAGSPTDLGGGGEEHNLADIALAWMISQTMGMLKYDETYVEVSKLRLLEQFACPRARSRHSVKGLKLTRAPLLVPTPEHSWLQSSLGQAAPAPSNHSLLPPPAESTG